MNLEPYVEDVEDVNLTASNISASAVIMFGSGGSSNTDGGGDDGGGGFSSRTGVILGICLGAGCCLNSQRDTIHIVTKCPKVSHPAPTTQHRQCHRFLIPHWGTGSDCFFRHFCCCRAHSGWPPTLPGSIRSSSSGGWDCNGSFDSGGGIGAGDNCQL